MVREFDCIFRECISVPSENIFSAFYYRDVSDNLIDDVLGFAFAYFAFAFIQSFMAVCPVHCAVVACRFDFAKDRELSLKVWCHRYDICRVCGMSINHRDYLELCAVAVTQCSSLLILRFCLLKRFIGFNPLCSGRCWTVTHGLTRVIVGLSTLYFGCHVCQWWGCVVKC